MACLQGEAEKEMRACLSGQSVILFWVVKETEELRKGKGQSKGRCASM